MIMTNLQVAFIAIGLFFLVYFVPYFIATQPDYGSMKVILSGKDFSVKVADTKEERSKGLSGSSPLNDSEGMLFVFDDTGSHGFWMRDMSYSIDIIWISKDLKITHIEKSLSPETFPKVYYPEKPSLYVLEISSGQAEYLKLNIGDGVIFSKK